MSTQHIYIEINGRSNEVDIVKPVTINVKPVTINDKSETINDKSETINKPVWTCSYCRFTGCSNSFYPHQIMKHKEFRTKLFQEATLILQTKGIDKLRNYHYIALIEQLTGKLYRYGITRSDKLKTIYLAAADTETTAETEADTETKVETTSKAETTADTNHYWFK